MERQSSQATFAVLADGAIIMTDDEPMVETLTVLKDGSTTMPGDEPVASTWVKDNAYPANLPLECIHQ